MKNPNRFVKGSTICWYWGGEAQEKVDLQRALDELSLKLGYKSHAAPNSQRGRFVSVMEALATGELVVITAEEYARLKNPTGAA